MLSMPWRGWLVAAIVLGVSWSAPAVTVVYDVTSPALQIGGNRLERALRSVGLRAEQRLPAFSRKKADILVVVGSEQASAAAGMRVRVDRALGAEGFEILRSASGDAVVVEARTEAGGMYGMLELADEIEGGGGMGAVRAQRSLPRFGFRAIKFNLPWSPYRPGEATEQHVQTCRNIDFWVAFLDMMAENRFNALTLWNVHPFETMIRPGAFPEASTMSDEEFRQWRRFWLRLMRAAQERGIGLYILDWNIAVSPAFARAHAVKERNDTSDLVKRYNRECVKQLINEYPDLAGFGVGLGDWMNGMTSAQREQWIEETAIAGIKEAHRPVRFIHRAPFEGSTAADLRATITRAGMREKMPLVEIKFNWSHGHSTAAMQMTHSLPIDGFVQPPPTDYRIAWTVRNEDFFILRWGEPDFIRRHIAENGKEYVEGYFVGSEGYIPAKDYSHRDSPHRTWKYAFEKQWLFYAMWGRLLFDPKTPDGVFEADMDQRYGKGVGKDLLSAYRLGSRMPLRLASFHGATWDYTLYSEGFAAYARSNGLFDGVSPFISIDELIDHRVLDPAYVSIADFVRQKEWPAQRITPLRLADDLEKDGSEARRLVAGLRARGSATLECELDDAETWAWLSLYFAEKLRAGVALAEYRAGGAEARKQEAVQRLEKCVTCWEAVARITSGHYHEVPYVSGARFAWSNFTAEARRDVEIARNAHRR